jgi:hypothetical protein
MLTIECYYPYLQLTDSIHYKTINIDLEFIKAVI